MRGNNSTLTCSRLQELLSYDPETGEFRWKVTTSSSAKVGALAGYLNGKGYWEVGIDRRVYFAHHLAWLYTTGKWPDGEIDHINGVRADNRICNLRVVNRSQNMQNSTCSWGRSIHRGVCWHKGRKKWRAEIRINGGYKHLGYFHTEELAAAAYQEAQRKFQPFARVT